MSNLGNTDQKIVSILISVIKKQSGKLVRQPWIFPSEESCHYEGLMPVAVPYNREIALLRS